MKEQFFIEFERFNRGMTQTQWNRLGKIYQEQFKMCKTEINRLAKCFELPVKIKIALSKATSFENLKTLIDTLL